ncbi:MAG TPA: hypothetical protein VI216_04460 [Candidatus Acidoferrales bacterium]
MNDASLVAINQSIPNSLTASEPLPPVAPVPAKTQQVLRRMFADPRLLEKHECADLVADLRQCVAQHPNVSELRVLLGMALCVNLDAQAAMEELGEAVALAPDSFIAHLKAGELWMRLRVMNKAEDHTRQASLLAQNLAQSELARRQATTIRTMKREGIERDGYRTPWLSFGRLRRFWTRRRHSEELATADAQ